jgi:hypothetical protein
MHNKSVKLKSGRGRIHQHGIVICMYTATAGMVLTFSTDLVTLVKFSFQKMRFVFQLFHFFTTGKIFRIGKLRHRKIQFINSFISMHLCEHTVSHKSNKITETQYLYFTPVHLNWKCIAPSKPHTSNSKFPRRCVVMFWKMACNHESRESWRLFYTNAIVV